MVAIVGVALFFGRDTWATAKIGTVYVAKQTCSCLFVAGRPMDSCRTDYDPAAIKPLTVENDRQRRQGVCARRPGLRAGGVRAGLRLPSGRIEETAMNTAIRRSAIWTALAVSSCFVICARGARAAAAAARRCSVADERMADRSDAGRRRSRRARCSAGRCVRQAGGRPRRDARSRDHRRRQAGARAIRARLQRRHEAGVVVDGEVDHAGAGRRGRQARQGGRRRADGQSALGRERQARADSVAHLAANDGRHALPGDRSEDRRRQRRVAQAVRSRHGWTSRTTAPACR